MIMTLKTQHFNAILLTLGLHHPRHHVLPSHTGQTNAEGQHNAGQHQRNGVEQEQVAKMGEDLREI